MGAARSLGEIDASLSECQRILTQEGQRLAQLNVRAKSETIAMADTLMCGYEEILALLDHSQQQIWERS